MQRIRQSGNLVLVHRHAHGVVCLIVHIVGVQDSLRYLEMSPTLLSTWELGNHYSCGMFRDTFMETKILYESLIYKYL